MQLQCTSLWVTVGAVGAQSARHLISCHVRTRGAIAGIEIDLPHHGI